MSRPTHVMVDIETLSTKKNAVIVSIGAVRFDPRATLEEPVKLPNWFYSIVGVPSQQHRHIEPSTLSWWFKQNESARKAVEEALVCREHYTAALDRFAEWLLVGGEPQAIWANSPSFDLVILRDAFENTELRGSTPRTCPWSFRAERDFRTLRRLFPGTGSGACNAHNALADAAWQARTTQETYKAYPQLAV